eukprot:2243381-Pyramimonas_sp.AAC.1
MQFPAANSASSAGPCDMPPEIAAHRAAGSCDAPQFETPPKTLPNLAPSGFENLTFEQLKEKIKSLVPQANEGSAEGVTAALKGIFKSQKAVDLRTLKAAEESKESALWDTLEMAGFNFPTKARKGDPNGKVMAGRWDRWINNPKNAAQKLKYSSSGNRDAMAAFRAQWASEKASEHRKT